MYFLFQSMMSAKLLRRVTDITLPSRLRHLFRNTHQKESRSLALVLFSFSFILFFVQCKTYPNRGRK
jgi:hypothetical protein